MDGQIGRNFGFTSVLWEIQDHCLPEKITEWNLLSPEFCVDGRRLTKWQLGFGICEDMDKNNQYYFRLQSLGWEDYDGKATVDCYLEYNDHFGENHEQDFQCQLSVNELHDMKLFYPGFVVLTSIHAVPLVLKCRLLVSFADISESIPCCENIGIRELSMDMQGLYCGESGDVTFHLSHDKKRLVHKAILYHRIPNAEYRDKFTSRENKIRFEDFHYKAVEDVFRFLYTGNIKHAVVPPSTATFRFADLLHVKPIVTYYAPYKTTIASTIEDEKFSSSWTIKNFLGMNEKIIESPSMTNKTMDTKWCLRVNLAFKHTVHISVVVVSNTPKNVCAQLFVNKVSGGCVCFTGHKRVEGGDLIGYRDFLQKDRLFDYMINDSLTVNVRLRMAATDGETITSIRDTVSCHKCPSVQINYKCLSNDILSLFKEESYHDMRVNFYEQNIAYDVHKYFLLKRCSSLHDAFRKNDLTYFRGMNIVVIRELLYYLYSGTIDENLSIDDTFTLYGIGYYFNFESLKTVLLERLVESLDESNAKEIYNFAIDKNIERLRDAARIYITEGDLKK